MRREATLYYVIVTGAFGTLGMYMSLAAMSYYVFDMGGTATLTGEGQAMLAFSAVLVGPLVGKAVDKYGPRVMLLFGMFGHAFGHGTVALSPNFRFFLVSRFVHGLFYPATIPSCMKYIALLTSPGSERSFYMSRWSIVLSAAQLLSGPLAVLLMSFGSPRTAYMGGSISCFVMFVLALFFLPSVDEVKSRPGADPNVDGEGGAKAINNKYEHKGTRWCSLAGIVAGEFTLIFCIHPLFTVVTPQYIKRVLGWGPSIFGIVLIQNASVALLFQYFLYVRLNEAIGSLRSARLATVIMAVALAGYALVPYVVDNTGHNPAVAGFVIAQLLKSIAAAFGNSAAQQASTEVVHPDDVGYAASLVSTAGSASRLVGPPLLGSLFDYVSYNMPYIVSSAGAALGALAFSSAIANEALLSRTRTAPSHDMM